MTRMFWYNAQPNRSLNDAYSRAELNLAQLMAEEEQYKQVQEQNHARLLQDIGNALLEGKEPQQMKGMLARLEISQGSRELSSSQLNQIPTLELATSRTDNTVTIVHQPRKERTVQPHQLCLSTPSRPEPTSYQFKSSFDPSKSSNPYVKTFQSHRNNLLDFSCGTPGQVTTDFAKVNLSSAHPAASDTTKSSLSTIIAQSSSCPPVCAKVQQLETDIGEYEASLPHKSVTEVKDSWIPIYDKISWEDDGIEDLGLGVSSVQLDICEGPRMDKVIPSTTTSDKDTNSTEKISTVSCNVYKSITEVPAQEEFRDMLKEENNVFAIDMDISQPSLKQFAQLEKCYTTDQRSSLVMVFSGLIKDFQLKRHPVEQLGSDQFVDNVHGGLRMTWLFILSKANQELYLPLGFLWLQSIFEEMAFMRDTRKGMG